MDDEQFLTRWRSLPVETRLRVANAIPECGHALAETHSALQDLEREAAAAFATGEHAVLEGLLAA